MNFYKTDLQTLQIIMLTVFIILFHINRLTLYSFFVLVCKIKLPLYDLVLSTKRRSFIFKLKYRLFILLWQKIYKDIELYFWENQLPCVCYYSPEWDNIALRWIVAIPFFCKRDQREDLLFCRRDQFISW